MQDIAPKDCKIYLTSVWKTNLQGLEQKNGYVG